MTEPLAVGVVGVGSMGRNHARVFRELPAAELVGVADADAACVEAVAADYGTTPMDTEALLDAVDAVSIAVPTRHHYDVARAAIDRGVHPLVEKPFVERVERGEDLLDRARDAGVTLQVGHVERFNPAVRALSQLVGDIDVIAVDATRLGPPVDRDIDVNPVLDLMIHDIDVVRSILESEVTSVQAVRTRGDPYVTATLESANGVVTTLTASRVTQQKIRRLAITARECHVTVDYIDQSVEIHRRSMPEYVEDKGDVRFRDQNVVERPTVRNGEPLKAELESFVDAVREGADPVVTGEDGLEAVRLSRRITDVAQVEPEPSSLEVES